MSEPIITVENLSKRYRIGTKEQQNKSFREVLLEGITAPVRNLRRLNKMTKFRENNQVNNPHQGAAAEFENDVIWALKDVSFEIREGEVLGVIGRNGAGKSTLFKILSRVTEPTSGDIKIHGSISSLLEVGTGFHPELTGRENIFLNGAILGMTKKEINRKFDEIIAFAEIEKFLDTSVKYYSSGMYVRLAFAVAAHLEPDILIVDEVLAVGDAAFQKKCLGKMGDVAREGRTVLFVSHNMGTVRSLCSRALLIDRGRVVVEGEVSSVISNYLSSGIAEAGSKGHVVWTDGAKAPGGDGMRMRAIRLIGADGEICSAFEVDKPIKIEISYEIFPAGRGLRIYMWLLTSQGEMAFMTTDHNRRPPTVQPGKYKSICTIPGGLLNIGKYIVGVGSDIPGIRKLGDGEYLSFDTVGVGNHGSAYPEGILWPGVVCPKMDWQITPDE